MDRKRSLAGIESQKIPPAETGEVWFPKVPETMLENELSKEDSNDVEQRTIRALEESMTVLSTDGTPIHDSETDVVSVISSSGSTYIVDIRERTCTCPDHQHNGHICKHTRRARMVMGVDVIDVELIRAHDIDDDFGFHAPGHIVAASDGGHINADGVDTDVDTDTDETDSETDEITGHDQPQRSEKADFGGGESTGIQEL